MMVPNFMPCSYWKSSKFAEKMEKYMYLMQTNGQFCSAPQVHWVNSNKCIAGLMEGLLREMHF